MLLPVGDHHLRTVDLGRGTPLVLHDGWVASWELWLPLMERLQHEWRCVAYDHRGAGASTFPPESISAVGLVDDLFRVMDAAGVARCVVAGESLGSLVCLQAVLRDPSRFLGLVIVGGFPRAAPLPPGAAQRMRADWAGYVDGFVAASLPEPDAEPLRRLGRLSLLPAGPEAGVLMTSAHRDVVPDLAAVSVPTLVVHGGLDRIAPLDGARDLADRVPGARLVVLPDAGHVPILTRPDAVAAAIRDWWPGVRPAD